MTPTLTGGHAAEAEAMVRERNARAEASKADLVCRISEFRMVFGADHYAELMTEQAKAVADVITWQREERRLTEMLREQHENPVPIERW